jgi:hypothetical protein
MRPYGVSIIEHPDVADTLEMGSPGCVGNLRGRSGDFHDHYRNPASKAATRRHWKRIARRAGKAACKEDS